MFSVSALGGGITVDAKVFKVKVSAEERNDAHQPPRATRICHGTRT
jgi:hypothetical protein